MKLTDIVPSLIRTYVPLLIGLLANWLLRLGIEVDDDSKTILVATLSTLAAALYYAVVRVVETKYPQVGLFLGSIKQPIYVNPTKTPAEQQAKVDAKVEAVAKTPDTEHPPPGYA